MSMLLPEYVLLLRLWCKSVKTWEGRCLEVGFHSKKHFAHEISLKRHDICGGKFVAYPAAFRAELTYD